MTPETASSARQADAAEPDRPPLSADGHRAPPPHDAPVDGPALGREHAAVPAAPRTDETADGPASDVEAPGQKAMVHMEETTIRAADGLPLAATVFRPAGDTRAWCSIASANGVRRRFYRRFAAFLAEHGIACVTFDYRGIGDSPATWPGDPAHPATGPPRMQDFGEQDLEGVLRWLVAQDPPRLFHVGHSGGGQFLGLAPSNRHVEAAVVVASQSGYWRLWPKHRMRMWLLWHILLPASTRLRGHFPAPWFGMGEAMPKTVALQWARWCRHPDFIVDDDGQPMRENFERYRGRIKAIVVSDDDMFAPRPAVEALMGFYAHADTQVRLVHPDAIGQDVIGHFGWFRESGQPLWSQALDWLLGP